MGRRTIGWLVALATATAVAGCGTEDGTSFAEAANRTCERVSEAAGTLSTELVRGPGESEVAAVKTAIKRYAATVTAAADELEGAKPTGSEREFQRLAVARLRQQAEDLTVAADGGRGGDSRAKAVERLTAAADQPAPMVPPQVLDAAPACAEAAAR